MQCRGGRLNRFIRTWIMNERKSIYLMQLEDIFVSMTELIYVNPKFSFSKSKIQRIP